MSYTYNLGEEGTYIADSNAFGFLQSIGCNITQTLEKTVIDFSGRDMTSMACQAYVDPFRQSGLSARFDNADGNNKIILTGKSELRDFRSVGAKIAGYALDLKDTLGKDFARQVIEKGTLKVGTGAKLVVPNLTV